MTQKPKTQGKSAASRKARSPARSRTAELEHDVTELRRQLAAAEARVVALERQRDDALNRINWVIDSIKNLADTMK